MWPYIAKPASGEEIDTSTPIAWGVRGRIGHENEMEEKEDINAEHNILWD